MCDWCISKIPCYCECLVPYADDGHEKCGWCGHLLGDDDMDVGY